MIENEFACPYCGTKVEEIDVWEWEEGEAYDMDCPACGRSFQAYVEVEYIHHCLTRTPKELEKCEGNCPLWSFIGEYCSNTIGVSKLKRRKIEEDDIECPPEWCPLGYEEIKTVELGPGNGR